MSGAESLTGSPVEDVGIVADPGNAGKPGSRIAASGPVVTAPTGGADGGGGAVDAREGGRAAGS
jgi:hypothetical protein